MIMRPDLLSSHKKKKPSRHSVNVLEKLWSIQVVVVVRGINAVGMRTMMRVVIL
jgi:hypothetical protein